MNIYIMKRYIVSPHVWVETFGNILLTTTVAVINAFFCDIQKSCHVFTIFFQTELLLSSFLNVINGSIRFYFTRLKANMSSENDWDNFAHSSKMLLLFNYNEINILSLERSTNARRYKFESANAIKSCLPF